MKKKRMKQLDNLLVDLGLLKPPKKSRKKKILGFGLGTTAIALGAGAFVRERNPQ